MEWIVGGFVLVVFVGLVGSMLTDALGGRWLRWWHGTGEPHQYQVYRCHACRALVTWHQIRAGGCPCHESSKISPTHLRLGAKARLLFLPWRVTPLKARAEALRRTRLATPR